MLSPFPTSLTHKTIPIASLNRRMGGVAGRTAGYVVSNAFLSYVDQICEGSGIAVGWDGYRASHSPDSRSHAVDGELGQGDDNGLSKQSMNCHETRLAYGITRRTERLTFSFLRSTLTRSHLASALLQVSPHNIRGCVPFAA